MKRFENKVTVITGGGGIICSEFAKVLAKEGSKVAILDLNLDSAQRIADEINADEGTAIGVKCNVLDIENMKAARETVTKCLGKCDFLINGAGGNNPKGNTNKETFNMDDMKNSEVTTFFGLDPKGFEFVFNLNFMGTLIPSQVFAEQMVGREGVSIINISSMSAFSPLTMIPAYSAAKSAISNFTQWLSVYFAESGIRVNALSPGFLVTNQNRNLLLNEDGTLKERGSKIISHTPMRRFGIPEELCGTLIYLLDYDMSKFVTGVNIPVDGGFMAFSGV